MGPMKEIIETSCTPFEFIGIIGNNITIVLCTLFRDILYYYDSTCLMSILALLKLMLFLNVLDRFRQAKSVEDI